ncbi:major facilitator superfamily protein [Clostridium puniceum]|uniref:Major facilitator superfamily protein n=1 Tax=Clostridium puniceum TaxID=29367 RepID=A0A1S8T8F8_9CLOT|nr:MFS transporter [Clostridium puniceum]OOM74077.1 major facilitator superfamily protein [Clostridium puniceum]
MDKRKITIAVLCMSTLALCYILIAPLLAEMNKSFPSATATQIQLIYTIPSMIAIPAMLISGKMVYYFSKKNMILISMIIIVMSSLLPVLFNGSLTILYLTSGLMGSGLGVVTTLSSNIVSDYFEDLERASIMGYQSAAISIGGAILSAISGKVATINWSYSYLILLLFIPCIFIVLKFLPKDSPIEKVGKADSTINIRLLYFAFLSFLCQIFVTGYNSNIAFFIQNKNIGSVEAAGTVNSLFMLIGIPAGFIVGKLTKIFKRNIFFVAVAFISCGFFITAFSTDIKLVYLGAFFIGFGFSVRAPSAMTFAVNMVTSESAAMAIAIVGALSNVGNFIAPFIINMIGNIVGNDVSKIFTVCGICTIVISGLYLFTNPVKKYI